MCPKFRQFIAYCANILYKFCNKRHINSQPFGLGGAAAAVSSESDAGPSGESEKRNCREKQQALRKFSEAAQVKFCKLYI